MIYRRIREGKREREKRNLELRSNKTNFRPYDHNHNHNKHRHRNSLKFVNQRNPSPYPDFLMMEHMNTSIGLIPESLGMEVTSLPVVSIKPSADFSSPEGKRI